MKISKRGQITVFIIIGIVLLLIFALFLYIRSLRVERIPEVPEIEEIPTELAPIRNYVQDCLKDTIADGFRVLGARAGYINPDENGIKVSDDPTESNAVSFFPDPNAPPVAYWYYFSSRNDCNTDCRCVTKQPPICKSERAECFSRGENSIEEQLERYTKENLKTCIQNFAPFIEQGFRITALDEVEPEITITKNNVRAYLKYPLEVEKAGSKEAIPDFYIEFPFDFMKIYEFALQITKAEREYGFFEKWIMYTIDGLGGLDAEIPKTYSVDFSPSTPTTWRVSTVKEHLINNILPGYVSALRVYNTQNFEPMVFQNDIATGLYRFRDLPVGTSHGFRFDDLKVNFNYFSYWPIYFDIDGRGVEGNVIGPEQSSAFEEFFSWLGLKRYQYYYDISFPVIVDITDQTQTAKNLFGPDGYRFLFALEANIRNNEELDCEGPGLDLIAPPGGSNLCKPIHFKSGDILIETIDKKTKEPLEDVTVVYQCGKKVGCDIGYTQIETNSTSINFNKAVLDTKLPYPCAGGYLRLAKEGYFIDPIRYNTAPKKDDTLVIELEPVRRVKARIVKKRIVKYRGDWVPASGFGALLPNEVAIVSLTRIKPTIEAADFATLISVQGDKEVEVELIPGDYEITGTLNYNLPALDREQIVFGDERICAGTKVGEDCIGEWQTLHVDPFKESFMEGGVEIDSVKIQESYLDNYETLYFKVVSVPDSSSFDQLSFGDIALVGNYSRFSQTLRAELIPSPFVTIYDYMLLDNNPMTDIE
ncbi:hypothetical protein KY342_03285 [Candidatus Woesearchaeota archaeon]|nr:hypothetical protein [Candidatus Woesearchaeota archaeon]